MISIHERRAFLRDGLLLASGALGGGLSVAALLKGSAPRTEAADTVTGPE